MTTPSFLEVDGLDSSDSETPALWEVSLLTTSSSLLIHSLLSLSLSSLVQSCWIPILDALSCGIRDHRVSVRRSAVSALCSAMTDKHASAVPVAVLVTILRDVVMPSARWLGEDLVQSIANNTYVSTLNAAEGDAADVVESSELYAQQRGVQFQQPFEEKINASSIKLPAIAKEGVTAELLRLLCRVSTFLTT